MQGELDEVVKEAARHTVINVETREPSLEEIFLRAYRDGDETMSALLAVSIRTQRRAAIGWGIGLAAVATMYAAFYPSITEGAAQLQSYMDNLPEAIRKLIGVDYTSPAGYLRAELFAMLGPILFLVYAVGAGARAVAGEEESALARPAAVDAADAHPDRARQGASPCWSRCPASRRSCSWWSW